jgi:prepilin-type N-terminal cleavage/methylation domain-containing protein/prepilin-type processing-associated H-X9-DG protein
MGRTRGFTLIELLVVVAIVAILAGMLMPVLGLVREAARSTRCASSLGQVGLGIQAYTFDNDGILPTTMVDAAHNYPWYALVSTYVEASPTEPATAVTIRRTSVIWGCPAFRRSSAPSLTWKERSGFGLNMYPLFQASRPNLEKFVHSDLTWLPGLGTGAWYTVGNLALNRVTAAASRTLVGESSNFYTTATLPAATNLFGFAKAGVFEQGQGWVYNDGDPERHRGKANYCFFDGHVQSVPKDRGWMTLYSPEIF